MTAKVIFANPASRLAAAQVAENDYLVFEYMGNEHLREGELLENLNERPGHVICRRSSGRKITINILSPSMSYARAKLVVAPWQDEKEWALEKEWELSASF